MNNFELSKHVRGFLSCHAWGRRRAMPRQEVLENMRLFDEKLDDRRLRLIYVQFACCCEDGIFIPARKEEIEDCFRYLLKKNSKERAVLRYERLKREYARFYPSPQVQKELFK